MRRSVLAAAFSLCAVAATAQEPVPPPAVAAKIAQLDQACAAAGGRQVREPYVFVHDFTGDGVNDFLISEGNYRCAGRPDLFRKDNTAVVEIYVSDGRGGASLVFSERLLAYRILDARPRVVQIARVGAACGAGGPSNARCGATLNWNAQARQFAAVPTGASVNGPSAPAQAMAQAPTPPTVPSPTAPQAPRAPVAAAPSPSVVAAPVAAAPAMESQAAFQARCRREILAVNKEAARWVDGECQEVWKRAQASKPMVDAALALIPEAGPPPRDAAAVKASLPSVRWAARPAATLLAGGKLGLLDVVVEGKRQVGSVGFMWSKTGDIAPYDVPQAFKARGAGVTLVGCQQLGVGETTKVFRINAAGRPPFGVSIYARDAPTANAEAFYNVSVDMTGRAPTLAALRATRDGADMAATCPP